MKLVTAAEMQQFDKEAQEIYGISGLLLMEQAARAVAEVAAAMVKPGESIVILCGKGNNGGDGFGAGRYLLSYGHQVQVLLVGSLENITGDAAAELDMYIKAGGKVTEIKAAEDIVLAEVTCLKAGLIIDGLVGTGFKGALEGIYKSLCAIANSSRARRLAIDLPSGVNCNNGQVTAGAFKAEATVTMAMVKVGLLLEPARSYCGRLYVANLGTPVALGAQVQGRQLITKELVAGLMPVRPQDSHKGDAGRVTICAGSPGFIGAAALCSEAAVKAGAGLVSLLTPMTSRDPLAIKLNEVMVHGLLERMPGILGGGAAGDIVTRANQGQVLAIGPGLGTSEATQDNICRVLEQVQVPVVIDADAITALAGKEELLTKMEAPKVLTPHVGEMARLTGLTIEEIKENPLEIAVTYAKKYQAVILLKGAPTIIACPDGAVYFNTSGCNAMATGGCGDVLTGIIASFIGQGLNVAQAAICGTYLHGFAGEIATKGEAGLAASQLAPLLPSLRQELRTKAAEEKVYNIGIKVIK